MSRRPAEQGTSETKYNISCVVFNIFRQNCTEKDTVYCHQNERLCQFLSIVLAKHPSPGVWQEECEMISGVVILCVCVPSPTPSSSWWNPQPPVCRTWPSRSGNGCIAWWRLTCRNLGGKTRGESRTEGNIWTNYFYYLSCKLSICLISILLFMCTTIWCIRTKYSTTLKYQFWLLNTSLWFLETFWCSV